MDDSNALDLGLGFWAPSQKPGAWIGELRWIFTLLRRREGRRSRNLADVHIRPLSRGFL